MCLNKIWLNKMWLNKKNSNLSFHDGVPIIHLMHFGQKIIQTMMILNRNRSKLENQSFQIRDKIVPKSFQNRSKIVPESSKHLSKIVKMKVRGRSWIIFGAFLGRGWGLILELFFDQISVCFLICFLIAVLIDFWSIPDLILEGFLNQKWNRCEKSKSLKNLVFLKDNYYFWRFGGSRYGQNSI